MSLRNKENFDTCFVKLILFFLSKDKLTIFIEKIKTTINPIRTITPRFLQKIVDRKQKSK